MPTGPEHRLHEGPFQPDLEAALAAEVAALRRADPLGPIILLVGSNLLGLHLTRSLARRLGGVAGLRPMTILDLARAVALPPSGSPGREPISEAGERLLARRAAGTLAAGSYFERIRDTNGFEEALLGSLRDLREAGIDAGRLRAVFPGGDRKMRELASLLEAYEGGLRRARLVDRAGLLAEAVATLDAGATAARARPLPAGLAGIARLLVYGFYDFNWLQRRLLEGLLRRVPVTVFFPWRDGAAHEYARPAREWFDSLGLRRAPGSAPGGGTAAPSIGGGFGDVPPAGSRLARLRERLFTSPGDPQAPAQAAADESLRIIAAPGEWREAVEAARVIVDAAREGVPFEEMAVLHRGGGDYPRLLAPILEEIGVPFHGEGAPLRQARPARALLCLLDMKETDYERSLVADFFALSEPALDAGTEAGDGTGGGGSEPADTPAGGADWDRLSRLAGITSGRRSWGERLERLAGSLARRARRGTAEDPEAEPPPDPRLVEAARRLPRLFARLARSVEAIPREGAWAVLARAVASALRGFVPPSPDREAVIEAVESLAALQIIQERTTLREFRRMLELELDRRDRGAGRFQRGHVLVADALAARGLPFRVVIVLGMVEQSFPAPPRQDPILLDEERQALNRAPGGGAERLPVKARRSLEERLLFALAAASAGGRLILTFPRIDPDSARERVPSSFLLWALEAATGAPCDYDTLMAWPGLTRVRLSDLAPGGTARALREREFDLASASAGVEARHAGRALLPALRPGAAPFLLRGLRFEQARWGSARFTPYDGRLESAGALRLLAGRFDLAGTPVSPTRLEQYMTCPYQYFCQRVLGLQALEAPEEIDRMSPGDRGALMHGVLHELFAALRERGRLRLSRAAAPALLADLRAILLRRFAAYERIGLAGPTLLAAIDREAIEADLARVLEAEIVRAEEEGPDAPRPAHFEVRFGMPAARHDPDDPPEDPLSRDAPATIEPEPGPALPFKGRIDRIDLSPDAARARVVDYKSGRIDGFEDDSHGGGTALQLPIYILAAEALLPGTRVEEAVYLSISRRGGFEQVRFGREAWGRSLADLRQVAGLVRTGTGGGAFFHHPDEKGHCAYCDYRPLCGEARAARFERKRADPLAGPFLAFKEKGAGGPA